MDTHNDKGLTIGELAKTAAVNVETIRYYQKRGLLPHIPSPSSGFKRYPKEFLERISFIKSAQHMDFSLNEIKELFELSSHVVDKAQIRNVARERLRQVHAKKQHLTHVETTLKKWLNSCEHSKADEICPIIQSIKVAQ